MSYIQNIEKVNYIGDSFEYIKLINNKLYSFNSFNIDIFELYFSKKSIQIQGKVIFLIPINLQTHL